MGRQGFGFHVETGEFKIKAADWNKIW